MESVILAILIALAYQVNAESWKSSQDQQSHSGESTQSTQYDSFSPNTIPAGSLPSASYFGFKKPQSPDLTDFGSGYDVQYGSNLPGSASYYQGHRVSEGNNQLNGYNNFNIGKVVDGAPVRYNVREEEVQVIREVIQRVAHPVPVPVPQPVRVPIPQPYPIHLPIVKNVPVPIVKINYVKVDKPVPYAVEKIVKVPYVKIVKVPVDYPVPVERIVKVPIVKWVKVPVPVVKSYAAPTVVKTVHHLAH